MIMTGVLVNVGAIVICSLVGAFLVKGVPERYSDIITKAIGLSVLFVGINGAMDNKNVMLLIISMVIGSLIGEWIDIYSAMNKLGIYAETRLGFGEGTFAKGFVTASILFCTGSMAIVGSLNSGLMANHDMLFAKSILDGVIAVVFSSTMGIGVGFSAIPILLYEGGITLGASLVKDFLTPEMINEMSAVGSLLIAAIGFNFLDIKPIRVANMIPAMFIPCVYYYALSLF